MSFVLLKGHNEMGLASAGAVSPTNRSRQDCLPDGPGRCTIPPKLYRVQEVVWHTGLSRKTLHNYAVMGLIREHTWTPGGHRLFDESVFERLHRIGELKKTHRLAEIRSLMAGETFAGDLSGAPSGAT